MHRPFSNHASGSEHTNDEPNHAAGDELINIDTDIEEGQNSITAVPFTFKAVESWGSDGSPIYFDVNDLPREVILKIIETEQGWCCDDPDWQLTLQDNTFAPCLGHKLRKAKVTWLLDCMRLYADLICFNDGKPCFARDDSAETLLLPLHPDMRVNLTPYDAGYWITTAYKLAGPKGRYKYLYA